MQLAWPTAIAHCDADYFFVGCELSRNSFLKDKPVAVVASLGGIVLSGSPQLKRTGVKTGMPIWEARKLCPQMLALKTDFAWYQHCSHRMMMILKTWSPVVEQVSVDEAFLDLQGLVKLYRKDYGEIALGIKEQIKRELGFTVSIGVSVTKTLAKMASELNKPDGVTMISRPEIPSCLSHFVIDQVPGIGKKTAPLLKKFGIETCRDFVSTTEQEIKTLLHRPGIDLWKELQGQQMFFLSTHISPPASIQRTGSFSPLSCDPVFLWKQTIRHLEEAISRLHEDGQLAAEVGLYFRDKDFQRYHTAVALETPGNSFSVFVAALRRLWKQHFPKGKLLRSTGVSLLQLSKDEGQQMNLFEDPEKFLRKQRLEQVKALIQSRFGFSILHSASLVSKTF